MSVVPFRPHYETADTIAVERRIAAWLATQWRCEFAKLPVSYGLDYAALRDKQLMSWVEIKRRHRELHEHRCVFLSIQKVSAAYHYFTVSRKPAFFVVLFNDCLAYAPILKDRPIEFRGRTDRGDWQDQEAVTVISPFEFTVLHAGSPDEVAAA